MSTISALSRCRLPWWWAPFGRSPPSLADRKDCEELAMAIVLLLPRRCVQDFLRTSVWVCSGTWELQWLGRIWRGRKRKRRRGKQWSCFFLWVSMGGKRNSIGLENLGSWVFSKVQPDETASPPPLFCLWEMPTKDGSSLCLGCDYFWGQTSSCGL